MKTTNRRMSDNVEDRRGGTNGSMLKGESNGSRTAERDKASVRDWDGRLGGSAGQPESGKKLKRLWDSAPAQKLTDAVYPKPHKQAEMGYSKKEVSKAKADSFPLPKDLD